MLPVNPALRALLLLLATLARPGFAEQDTVVMPGDDMYEKKAKVVYNLSRFTYWPEQALADPAFNICLLGDADALLGRSLAKMSEDKLIHGHKVSFRKLAGMADALCHVAVLGRNLPASLPEVIRVLHSKKVLTISEIPNFTQQGGIIELLQTGARVRFSINLDAANQAGLSFNAQLLVMTSTSLIGKVPGEE